LIDLLPPRYQDPGLAYSFGGEFFGVWPPAETAAAMRAAARDVGACSEMMMVPPGPVSLYIYQTIYLHSYLFSLSFLDY